MRILLVGATGFIGRHLLRSLAAEGHDLIATSRSGSGPQLPRVRWLALDLEQLAQRPDSFAWPVEVDLLINAAGLLDSDLERLIRAQDVGARRLFNLAAANGVRVLQFSALGASEQPDVPFLASKAAADAHLLALGVPAVVLRPSLVLGEGGASSAWFARLSPWPLIPLLDTRAQVQPLHVDDLVAAVLALLRQWPEQPVVLPLVGPHAMTVPQLLDRLRRAQGWRPARYLAQLGIAGRPAAAAIVAGALLDALLGLGLLWRRWRRLALLAQMGLMLGYMLIISLWLPHYWFDPFAAVGKNLVLLVATLWLWLSEPSANEGTR